VAKRFWTSFNIWLSSALDLEVFELTPKETVLGIFSDESSLQKIVPFLFLVVHTFSIQAYEIHSLFKDICHQTLIYTLYIIIYT
jgi:hypothetical protein